MTNKKIFENNKLIAEFMGEKYDKDPNYLGELIYDDYINSPKIIKYNSSWNWLMPVVEKIESMYYNPQTKQNDGLLCKFMDKTMHANDNCDWYIEGNVFAIIFEGIDDLYSRVVKFIKWYNDLQ